MKYLLILFILFLNFNYSFAQTQTQMNQDAKADYLKIDKQLNATYQKILTEYREDTVFIKNFKNAQRLWVQFRDAEMKAIYPDREEGYYGSVQPMCWYQQLSSITNTRLKEIKIWLIGISEGDVCSGSIKTTSQ